MAPDDEPDDRPPGAGGPLPPEDRLWRHPSELAGEARGVGGGASTAPARGGRGLAVAALASAALAGAVVAVGFMWVTRPTRTVVHEADTAAGRPETSASFVTTTVPSDALARRYAPSLARVEVERDGAWIGGTGVWIDDAGALAVAAPLVAGAGRIVVRDDEGRAVDAVELASDPDTGIAVVEAGAARGVPVDAETADLRAGVAVSTVGAPGPGSDDATWVLPATVSAADGRSGSDPWVWHGVAELDRSVDAEGTGCVVVDAAGRLLGLVLGNDDGDQLAVVVPADDALAVARELRDTGEVQRAWLGVQATDLAPDEAVRLEVRGGAVITEVTDGSPAQTAGLQAGDVVTAVGEAPVDDASDLVVALRAQHPGDVAEVAVRRDDREVAAEVTLGG